MRAIVLLLAAAALQAADLMPHDQQTALVMKYCAVCHTDAARNGGLTLQHFDAAKLDPSLAAMLVAKLRTGAMGASGISRPDESVTQALTAALAAESVGANRWTVTNQSASILQESSQESTGTKYRLVLECNPATREGDIQISWAPNATNGTLHASLDGKAPVPYAVEGTEKMGNGQGANAQRAAIKLRSVMPAQSLAISNIFPNEKVVFPFDTLPEGARQTLSACFPAQ
ncbi:MAG: hypothetical protein ABI806_07285 [Candidatus Solibacter sp.]